MAVPDNQRLVRLFGAWVEIAPHPLDSLLDAYYGIIRLENDICGKEVVEIWIAFDYNKRTFVPIPDPVYGTSRQKNDDDDDDNDPNPNNIISSSSSTTMVTTTTTTTIRVPTLFDV